MKKDRIALQIYSVRDDIQEDFYGTLKKIKDMGYSGVEFAGIYGRNPDEVREMCDEIGLTIVSFHISFGGLKDSVDDTIDCCRKLGCRYFVISYLQEEYRPGTDGYSTFVDVVGDVAEKLSEFGIVLQYHNHDFEFEKINGEYALDIMFKDCGPEKLQAQFDTCWVNVGGADPVEYLKKYSGRIPTVHLKDFAGCRENSEYGKVDDSKADRLSGKFELRPLGYGVQDIHAIVDAATEGGAEWFVVEQDTPSKGRTAMECAEISVKYLLNEVVKSDN